MAVIGKCEFRHNTTVQYDINSRFPGERGRTFSPGNAWKNLDNPTVIRPRRLGGIMECSLLTM